VSTRAEGVEVAVGSTAVGLIPLGLPDPEEGHGVGRRAAAGKRGPTIALAVLLARACAPVGIAEDWRVAFVNVYNQTQAVVSFDGVWVPICSMGSRSGLPPWPSPVMSAPPGAVAINVDLDVPPDYTGVLSVIISEEGLEVVRGEVDEESLPECAGRPPA
jgi:hypothetical protein